MNNVPQSETVAAAILHRNKKDTKPFAYRTGMTETGNSKRKSTALAKLMAKSSKRT